MSRAVPAPTAPRTSLLLRIVLLAVTLWIAAGYLLVPWAVHRWIPPVVASVLDAQLDIGDVHFDPLLMRLRLFDVQLRGPLTAADFEAGEVLAADLVEADLSAETLLHGGPVIALRVDGFALRLERAENGDANLLALLRPADPDADAGNDAPAALPRLVASLALDAGTVRIVDHGRPSTFETRLTDLEASVTRLTLPRGDAAPWRLAARIEGASITADGTASVTPTLDAALRLADVPLELVDRWLADATPARDLSGSLDLDADLRLDADGITTLESASLRVSEFGVRTEAPLPAGLRFTRLSVDGVSGPLTPVDVRIDRVGLEAPRIDARWDPRNAAAPVAPDAVQDPAPAADRPPEGPAATAEAERPAPRLRVASIEISDLAADLVDASLPQAARLVLDRGRLDAGPLAWPARDPVALDLALRIAGSGMLSASGSADLAAPGAELQVDLTGLDLAPFAPWADAWSRIGLRTGTLGLSLDLELDGGDAGALQVAGSADLSDLAIDDPDGVSLLGWDRLALEGIDVDTGATRFRLGAVELQAPRARFARLADGSTNVDDIGPRPHMVAEPSSGSGAENGAENGAEAGAETGADTGTAKPTAGTEPAERPDAGDPEAGTWSWSVDRIGLDAGTLDFIDETLVIPFGTTIESLAGEVTDLGSDTDARSRIRLDGRVPPNGSARIEATLALLSPLQTTDLSMTFRQVPMPRLTPYVGTFAGYRVASGRLDLDLDYRIRDARLDAGNHVVVDTLRLGPRIESPDALDLPLELALALLRDGNDQIVLDVPVSGDLNDPEFDLTPVIVRAIGNVFRNIIAAPFKLLGSLLPSGSAPIDQVEFAIGSATLPEDQLDRFLDLEAALIKRPSLQLLVRPTHAGGADRDALRIAELERRLTATGEGRDAALRQLFRDTFGAEDLAALEAQYAEADGAASTLEGELRGRLLSSVQLADGRLEALARERAQAVSDQLTDTGLPAERIRIAEDVQVVAPGSERVTMNFDLAADAPGPLPEGSAPDSGRG